METGLRGKRVLVTGGSGGIGAACARAFAAEGAEVVVHFHRGRDRADAVAGEVGGTAIGAALAAAVKLGQEAVTGGSGNLASSVTAAPDTQTRGLVSILFLSDGAQTRGTLEPLQGADLAKRAGIPVYTVALGTPNGSLNFGGGGFPGGAPFGGRRVPVPPDPETLRAIADRTGGAFFAAQSAKSLQSAYKKLGSRLGRKPGQGEITYGFLAAAAFLLVAAGLLSALWSPRLP